MLKDKGGTDFILNDPGMKKMSLGPLNMNLNVATDRGAFKKMRIEKGFCPGIGTLLCGGKTGGQT